MRSGKKLGQLTESLVAELPMTERESKQHCLIPDHKDMPMVLDLGRRMAFEETNIAEGFIQSFLNWFRRPTTKLVVGRPRLFGHKICIVGVHGWFPTKVLQTVVGVPKGTSARLCKMMEENLREFLNEQPLAYFEPSPIINVIPLEGAGCIDERTENHYNLFFGKFGDETRRNLIRGADTVIFVAHSQGAPVSSLLAARMMEDGLLRPLEQNVGMLTLAGVFHGPFPDLKSNLVVKYVEADAARELFDLNDPHGELSVRIQQSLTKLLDQDVLVSCVASWMDQVVPLYSATLLGIDHPNIWRAVYIDAHNYQPDFLSHLVTVTLKLANARVEGARLLLAQLTESLAGSLYQSNAHSTLYDDHRVYQVILHWLCQKDRYGNSISSSVLYPTEMKARNGQNPYVLPWVMRGVISLLNKLPDHELQNDMYLLRELHRKWRPDRKIWKELKLQLEPLHSKL